jgi:hypothetical protein
MRFVEDGLPVEVQLPSLDRVDKHDDEMMRTDVFTSRHGEDPSYTVTVVDLITYPDETRLLPVDPVARREVAGKGDETLRGLVDKCSHVAERAFNRWAGVLRWKAKAHWIGRREFKWHPGSWQCSLFDRASREKIWGIGQHVGPPIYVDFQVTSEQWGQIEGALAGGESSPVYFDLLYDAKWALEYDELRRFVIDAAAASEVYMKTRTLETMPQGVTAAVRDYVARANVSRFYQHLFPDILPQGRANAGWVEIKGDLHELFEARNTLLHDGTHDALKAADCQRYAKAATKLLNLV